jgi:hypothetical protein
LVLFGTDGVTADPRKRRDLLLEALQRLRYQVASTLLGQPKLVVISHSQPPDLSFPIHYSDCLADDLSLSVLYSAADVGDPLLPGEPTHHQHRGLRLRHPPLVALGTGGLVDIVAYRVPEALAERFDPVSLLAAIY